LSVGRRRFDLIAFDGDDTLWHNERHYVQARERFRQIVERCGASLSEEAITEAVNRTEVQNLPFFGYGVSSFVISLIETAIRLTGGRIAGGDVEELLAVAKLMVTSEIELFEGAREALEALSGECPLALITKGDLLHQRAKLDRSGLAPYFRHVDVVSHKTPDVYAEILARQAVPPSRFLMVGNSPRSDILPVLAIGGAAVHVPAAISWSHEDDDVPAGDEPRCRVIPTLLQLPALLETWPPGE
jgi:putative hydrolase of the HAD superfamily